jgi:hypothetical protein
MADSVTISTIQSILLMKMFGNKIIKDYLEYQEYKQSDVPFIPICFFFLHHHFYFDFPTPEFIFCFLFAFSIFVS